MSWVQVRLDQNHMATTFELHVSCDEARARAAEAVLRHAHREIARLENELSEFREGSPVFGLNRARAFEPVRITNSVRDLLQLAESLRGKSQGAFNPLCKSAPGKGAVLIAADGKHFFKTEDGVRLGFGAIGKGYALDQVKLLLVREGFSDYLLSAGGSSILLSGFAAPETPWTWAWSWKKDADGAYRGKRFAHASGRPVALGVSGTLEQGEHILHAEGRENSLSALVAHASAARADALSTALFVLGWRDISLFEDPLHPTALAWIDAEENIRWNGGFQNSWGSPC